MARPLNFRRFAARTSEVVGSPHTFFLAVALVVGWSFFGPYFHWSAGHQLFINTITTILTFLVVFLIQNTQNRDTKSLHLKIDELLKATRGARNSMIDLDRLSDQQLLRLEKEFKRLCDDEIRAAASEELDRREEEAELGLRDPPPRADAPGPRESGSRRNSPSDHFSEPATR